MNRSTTIRLARVLIAMLALITASACTTTTGTEPVSNSVPRHSESTSIEEERTPTVETAPRETSLVTPSLGDVPPAASDRDVADASMGRLAFPGDRTGSAEAPFGAERYDIAEPQPRPEASLPRLADRVSPDRPHADNLHLPEVREDTGRAAQSPSPDTDSNDLPLPVTPPVDRAGLFAGSAPAAALAAQQSEALTGPSASHASSDATQARPGASSPSPAPSSSTRVPGVTVEPETAETQSAETNSAVAGETGPTALPPGEVSAAQARSAGSRGAEGASTAAAARAREVAGWNERATVIASGGEIAVVLPGAGWLYVGKEYGDGEIRLLGKRSVGGNDEFRFRIDEAGEYGLWFQQQDATTGALVNERLGLRAVPEGAAQSVVVSDLPLGGTIAALTTPAVEAPEWESIEATGDRTLPYSSQEAREGVIGNELSEAPPVSVVDRIATLVRSGDVDAARALTGEAIERSEIVFDSLDDGVIASLLDVDTIGSTPALSRGFWRAIASSGSSRAPEARRQLVELALAHGGASELGEALTLLDDAGEARADELARGALLLADAGSQQAVPLLARAVSGDRAGGDAARLAYESDDETLYELARFLERPGEHRDLRRSAAIYEHIVDDRPLSSRWDDSRERLEFLRRHYFDVR